jgi:hypothetical protein
VIGEAAYSLLVLPGDFNHDDTVDAADYVVWRNGLGTMYTQNDYEAWQAHFGLVAVAASGVSRPGVPEPATALLDFIAMLPKLILVNCSLRRRQAKVYVRLDLPRYSVCEANRSKRRIGALFSAGTSVIEGDNRRTLFFQLEPGS